MRFAAASLLAFVLIGCGNPPASNTPAPVNSAQTQAHNINKTLADSINAAVKTAITMRDQGKLSQGTTATIELWAQPATIISDNIEMELTSTDTWTVQKGKILVLLTTFKMPNTGPVETTVQAALTAVGAILAQLKAQVSQ